MLAIYCVCSDTKTCGGSFVSTLHFKHYLKKPAGTALELVQQAINNLSVEDKEALKLSMDSLLAGV